MAVPEMKDNQELLNVFYEEEQSLIDEMRKHLSALREQSVSNSEGRKKKSSVTPSSEPFALPEGKPHVDPSVLRSLQRCAHTIKGNSGIVGFAYLEELARPLEMIFKAARDGKITIDAHNVILLSESIEACQKALKGQEIVDREGLLERLNSILRP